MPPGASTPCEIEPSPAVGSRGDKDPALRLRLRTHDIREPVPVGWYWKPLMSWLETLLRPVLIEIFEISKNLDGERKWHHVGRGRRRSPRDDGAAGKGLDNKHLALVVM